MAEQWSYAEVATYLGITVGAVRKYASAGRLPEPDGRVAASPWWAPETIREWHEARPGVGGRPRKVQP